MSGNSKLEKDYTESNQTIERKAKEELKKIEERINKVKKEAAKIIENLEPQGKDKS